MIILFLNTELNSHEMLPILYRIKLYAQYTNGQPKPSKSNQSV